MHENPVGRLTELWGRADLLAQRMAATDGVDRSWSGADDTGMVTVTVDATGRIVEIGIEPEWRRRVGTDELGDAVRGAAERAGQARLADWAASFARQAPVPGAHPGPMPPLRESVAYRLHEATRGGMTSAEGRLALRELRSLLTSVRRAVDDVSAQVRGQADATYTGRNGSGDVAVTVTGAGAVTRVGYHRHWLAEATGQWIGRETLTACRAAYQEAADNSVEALLARGAMGEVRELAEDPAVLARRMRLA
ncbi:hypothetical protein ABGB07_27965 [Micromonosporaceae bacterium B7E4]